MVIAEDEAATVAEAWRAYRAGELGVSGSGLAPDTAEVSLALYGVAGCGPTEIRRRVSIFRIVGDSARSGWRTLRRWLDALADCALFPSLRALPGTRR